MLRLGIDIGASSCQFILLREGDVLYRKSVLHRNKVRTTVLTILPEVQREIGAETVLLSICGTMAHLFGLSADYVSSEVLALNTGIQHVYPHAGSCVMIGTQNTLYIERDSDREPVIRRNSNCSSGTGSFFEEQAGRLEIDLEDISELVRRAKSVPHIAGRCSVFSKTDIIHHMQEGTPSADLLLGLCYALVRNYKANILQNHAVKRPVLLCGGVMKNAGVLQAIRELLELKDEDNDRIHVPAA